MSEERLIKKYANRRLYDASQSRHITLDDIRTLVVAGERVKVIEDKTNEDITRLILLQVIADQEQFGRPILSTPLLESLIRFYGNSLQGFLSTYLEKSVETFMRQQESCRPAARMMTAHRSARCRADPPESRAVGKMQESMLAASRRRARHRQGVRNESLRDQRDCVRPSVTRARSPPCATICFVAPKSHRSPRPADSPTSPARCRGTCTRGPRHPRVHAAVFEHRHCRRWRCARRRRAGRASCSWASHRYRFSLLEARLPGSAVPLYLVHCPAAFDRPRSTRRGRTSTCASWCCSVPRSKAASAWRSRRTSSIATTGTRRSMPLLLQDGVCVGPPVRADRAPSCRFTTSAIRACFRAGHDVRHRRRRPRAARRPDRTLERRRSTGCAKACVTRIA